MFHKHNSFTNTLSASDQVSAYTPGSFGTKEATNNFFVAPQPKGRQAGGSGSDSAGSAAARQMSFLGTLMRRVGINSGSVAQAHSIAATPSHTAISSSHGATSAVSSHGHGHDSHAAPWEGVNLWRTPYKGDGETVTQVKRNKGVLDRYVENRTRHIQQMQVMALRNKTVPTWVMMSRDKYFLAAQVTIGAYVIYQVATTVYQHLKAKDRLKLLKLLYKDNVN